MGTGDSFLVEPAYAELMREVGLDARTIFTDSRIKVWRSLPDRENATLDHVRAYGVPIRLHIKRYPAGKANMAAAELKGHALLLSAGVPSAKIIASGIGPDASAFIVLQDLAGYFAADKLLEQGFPFDKLLNATANLAAQLHGAQLHHRDLYLCHFMIEPASVDARLIDMTRVGRMSNPLTRRRWIVKDLAQFWYSTQSLPVSQQQRHRWLEQYCQSLGVSPDPLIGPIQKKAAAIARHDAKLRISQPRRNVSIGDTGKPVSDLKSEI